MGERRRGYRTGAQSGVRGPDIANNRFRLPKQLSEVQSDKHLTVVANPSHPSGSAPRTLAWDIRYSIPVNPQSRFANRMCLTHIGAWKPS